MCKFFKNQMTTRLKSMGRKRGGRSQGPSSKRRRNKFEELSAKQKKHLKNFGELHPADISDTVRNYTKVELEDTKGESHDESSDSSDIDEESPYQQLLSTIGIDNLVDAEEEISDDDEDVDSHSSATEEEDFDRTGKDSKDMLLKSTGDLDKSSYDDGLKEDEDMQNDEEETESEENELSVDEEEECELTLKEDDPFTIHFEKDLLDEVIECLSSSTQWRKEEMKVKSLGEAILMWKDKSCLPGLTPLEKDLKKVGVKHRLVDQVAVTNIKECGINSLKNGDIMTPVQYGLFSVMNKYQDLLYPRETHKNGDSIRLTYCLHTVNHLLKTRSRVVAHNTKIQSKKKVATDTDCEYRDQGLTRPKVLIVVPLRHTAYRVVSLLISLLSASDQVNVSNRKRFTTEYGDKGHDDDKKGLKPVDFDALFSGNTDEHFRIGLSVSKKSLRLYSPFYMADIIIASPLGLRTIIGAQGDRSRDYDFLSSIEVLILDQADVFLMQNWDHVLHLFEHLHLQPREAHGADFSRVRMWALNGWSKYYRQTLIFSSVLLPELTSVFSKHCYNFAGKVLVHKKTTPGSICQIVVQLPQMFHRFTCSSVLSLADTRFEFFLKEILPQHKEKDMKQTLIYIPSYFDFVRIRNYFKKEAISFVHINEYASSKGIRRARIEFRRRKAHFMLYTERIHFYRRFKLRGPKHIIFYELPQYAHFYSEMCNMLEDPGRISSSATDTLTCSVLYSKYDAQKLAEVVGTERAKHMLTSDREVHMLVSGER